jgi:ABC-type dipeptide/oligopeptide/nickel transport system ATPase subunit
LPNRAKSGSNNGLHGSSGCGKIAYAALRTRLGSNTWFFEN